MGSYEELCITMVLRILLGQSLKISVIAITIKMIKNCNRKNMMGNSIYKTNIKCIKSSLHLLL